MLELGITFLIRNWAHGYDSMLLSQENHLPHSINSCSFYTKEGEGEEPTVATTVAMAKLDHQGLLIYSYPLMKVPTWMPANG